MFHRNPCITSLTLNFVDSSGLHFVLYTHLLSIDLVPNGNRIGVKLPTVVALGEQDNNSS